VVTPTGNVAPDVASQVGVNDPSTAATP